MIKLLINEPTKVALTETYFGGLPIRVIDQPYDWPMCAECQGHMKYMGKIKTDLGLELIFICENDPGMCGDEDPDGGANQVIILSELSSLEEFTIDAENTLRETEYNAVILEIEADTYDDARSNWQRGGRDILGQLHGQPNWIQDDETPKCECCQQNMRFVAQLEEGPEYETAMNFAGGCGFLFDCPEGKTAKFLWQC
jgi:hypothetical protein